MCRTVYRLVIYLEIFLTGFHLSAREIGTKGGRGFGSTHPPNQVGAKARKGSKEVILGLKSPSPICTPLGVGTSLWGYRGGFRSRAKQRFL
jgi:hypothetical protein